MNIIRLSSISLFLSVMIIFAGCNRSRVSMSQSSIKEEIERKTLKKTTFKLTNDSKTPQVHKRGDGTLIVNGKPFFILGIYHDSERSYDWNTTGLKLANDLNKIAEAGFNVVHPEIGGNYQNDIALFQEAQRLGIYVLPNLGSYEKRWENLNKYKDQPAILGWDIADDVDNPANGFTPELISEWHEKIQAVDPNHLTYVSGYNPDKIVPFMSTADLIGFQSYPIDNDPNDKKPLRNNYYTLFSVTNDKNQDLNKSIIANLQAFPWNDRPPTSKEIRNMTYAALINNVKGIMYYSYFIGETWDLSRQTELWQGMKSVITEVNNLMPILLEGRLTKLDTKVNDLYSGYWTYDNNIYVVVISTSPDKTIPVMLSIPAMSNSVAQSVFPERPRGMIFDNGKLTGSISPGDVHVYKLYKSKP